MIECTLCKNSDGVLWNEIKTVFIAKDSISPRPFIFKSFANICPLKKLPVDCISIRLATTLHLKEGYVSLTWIGRPPILSIELFMLLKSLAIKRGDDTVLASLLSSPQSKNLVWSSLLAYMMAIEDGLVV